MELIDTESYFLIYVIGRDRLPQKLCYKKQNKKSKSDWRFPRLGRSNKQIFKLRWTLIKPSARLDCRNFYIDTHIVL